ncbi:hypothetical protein SAMD00023353_2700760 [Rosellinia necatrix]|uniref:Uncharacterized protein n=1 Tax=Rosellinia necatrix TaxID=77044 RepID=A0A1W2TGV6_ROSNE|nr:hypothetical protein SAMD00023353_2700760 [Rosellinia necatrix]
MKGAATSATPSSSHFKQGSSSTGKGGSGGQQHLKTNIPLFSEAQVGQHVEVAVRLPSVYAAEWTKDHSKLHENGKCKCPVSFERYKPIDVGVNDDEAVSPKTKNFKVPRPAYKGGYKPSFHKPARYPKAPTDPVPSGRSNTQTSSFGGSPASGHSAPLSGHNQVPVGHAARWALKGDPGSLLDQILGPVGPDPTAYGDRPVDIQTMHFQNDSVPIVGKPLACGELEEDALPSIVEFAQPEITLAGFPIGAGPEGDSHAGPWDTCSLYSSYSNLGDMPPRTRPLSTGF